MNIRNISRQTKVYVSLSAVIVVALAIVITILLSGETGLSLDRDTADADHGSVSEGDGDYDYLEAKDHVGEEAVVRGRVLKVYTAKSGVSFFDFCQEFSSCPFYAVVFSDDLAKFGDLKQYEREVILSGIIKSYKGRAQMILNDPKQIK